MSYFKIHKIDAISSTNEYLKQLYLKKNIYDNFLIITNNQTEGKGQGSSSWESEPKKNLTLSIYKDLKKNKLKNPFIINLIISISIIETLKKYNLPNLKIKWPNDILSASKKISGILIENFFQREFLISSIIGIGLNVNQISFKKAKNAISIASIKKKKIDLTEVLNILTKKISLKFHEIDNLKINDLINEYESLLFKRDKFSKFNINNKIIDGRIIGVNQSGKLKVKIGNEIIREYNSSEIKIIY
ncbi:MAG: biotin--[acetyl-CoA-carboxylase] ligase [Flavobacteriaceae bacterium]